MIFFSSWVFVWFYCQNKSSLIGTIRKGFFHFFVLWIISGALMFVLLWRPGAILCWVICSGPLFFERIFILASIYYGLWVHLSCLCNLDLPFVNHSFISFVFSILVEYRFFKICPYHFLGFFSIYYNGLLFISNFINLDPLIFS